MKNFDLPRYISSIVVFYIQRKNTEYVRRDVEARSGPILANQYILSEIESAVYQLQFTKSQIQWFKTHLFTEIELGRIVIEKPDWEEVLKETTLFLKLVEGRLRTMDALHIAAAKAQEANAFVTTDRKQYTFAQSYFQGSIRISQRPQYTPNPC